VKRRRRLRRTRTRRHRDSGGFNIGDRWCHRMKNFRKWCGWDNTHRILYYQFFFILFISMRQ
jgi:hypothetical protein